MNIVEKNPVVVNVTRNVLVKNVFRYLSIIVQNINRIVSIVIVI